MRRAGELEDTAACPVSVLAVEALMVGAMLDGQVARVLGLSRKGKVWYGEMRENLTGTESGSF